MSKIRPLPIIVIILLCSVISLGYQLVSMRAKKQQIEKQTETAKAQLVQLDQLSRQYDLVQSDAANISKMLPQSESEFVGFTQTLSTIATQSGLQMILTNENKPTDVRLKNGSVKRLPMVIELEGSFAGHMAFFDRLYNTPYFMALESLDMTSRDTDLYTTMTILLYMQ